MLITPAYAQAAGAGGSDMLVQFAPLALIFVVFYFFLIRPQQQKAKQQRSMLDAIRRGDRVVTGGGIIGTVSKVINNDEVQVDIADNAQHDQPGAGADRARGGEGWQGQGRERCGRGI
jgi:preprotein translocase subunit YajC